MSAHATRRHPTPDGQDHGLTLATSFKAAMRRLTSTVTIITARHEGQRHGMTATAVTSLTASPPSLLICVNKSASIHDPIAESGQFCVNILACDHDHLVPIFGGKLAGEERFAAGDWLSDETGLPCLANAQATVVCAVAAAMSHGTHSIFIGEVGKVALAGSPAPLLYQEGGLFKSIALSN